MPGSLWPKMRRRQAGRRRPWRAIRSWPPAQSLRQFAPRRRSRLPRSRAELGEKERALKLFNCRSRHPRKRRLATDRIPGRSRLNFELGNYKRVAEMAEKAPPGCPRMRARRSCCSREIPSDNSASEGCAGRLRSLTPAIPQRSIFSRGALSSLADPLSIG